MGWGDKPNVVLIVSDDHGYADRSALGIHPEVSTPGLDRLAAAGVECTQAYVTAPVCSPSRAGLISGQYQARWGAHWFGDSSFPSHRPSLAERFGELGYATGYFGKVHYGPEDVGDRACPPHHGFAETYYGLAGKQQGRLNYLRHSPAAVEEYGDEASWRMAVQPMLEGDDEVELEGFLTDELGTRSRAFVTRHADEPFFLMLAFNAVQTSAGSSRRTSCASAGYRAGPTGTMVTRSTTRVGTTARSRRTSTTAGSTTWPSSS